MKTLLKGGLTGEIMLMENRKIIGIGDSTQADIIEDVTGK